MLVVALALVAPAHAADPQPALLGFTARPNTGVAVETGSQGAWIGLPYTGGLGVYGGFVRGTAPLSDRATLDLRGQVARYQGCAGSMRRSGGFGCEDEVLGDGVVRLGYAIRDRSRFRVMPYVGAGTLLEAGVALWWGSPDGRFELDVAAGAAFDALALVPGEPQTWTDVREPAPNLVFRPDASVPELGLTLHLDDRDLAHLRLGHFAHVPTVGLRLDPGKLGFEVTGGASLAGVVAQGGLSGQF